MYHNKKNTQLSYSYLVKGKANAARCVECGLCETKCPQFIKIVDKLKEAEEAILE